MFSYYSTKTCVRFCCDQLLFLLFEATKPRDAKCVYKSSSATSHDADTAGNAIVADRSTGTISRVGKIN